MQTSSTPALNASSTMASITGFARPSRSMIGNSSFLIAFVAGKSRVPNPAAGMTALRTLRPERRTSFRHDIPRSRSMISMAFAWLASSRTMNCAVPSPCEPTPLPPRTWGFKGSWPRTL